MTKEQVIDEAIRATQRELDLTADGVFGPITTAKAAKYNIKFIAVASQIDDLKPEAPAVSGDYFGAPWIGSYIHLLGKTETDPELNAALVPEWAKEGLPSYKSLSGNDRAWCSVLVNASFRKVA